MKALVKAERKPGLWLSEVPLPELGLLFPPIILPNHERSDLMGDEVVNDAATGRMEVTVHLTEALVGEEVEAV